MHAATYLIYHYNDRFISIIKFDLFGLNLFYSLLWKDK